jgi:hypothetical protein
MDVTSILDLITNHLDILKTNLSCLFQIIGDVKGFVSSRNFDEPQELIAASIFAALMSLVCLTIRMPLLLAQNVPAEQAQYLIRDTITTYLIWLLCGISFHLSAKLLRGSGSLRKGIVIWLFMQAFDPVFLIAFLPADLVLGPLMIKADAPFTALAQSKLINTMPVIAGEVLGGAVFVWFVISLGRAYGLAYGLGRLRAALVVLLGFAGVLLIELFQGFPLERSMWGIK